MPMRRSQSNSINNFQNEVQKPVDLDVVRCPECECSWFEQIQICQFPKLHTVILGQRVQAANQMEGFFGLRCVKCGEIIEPNIQFGIHNAASKKYNEFWKEMENPGKGEKI